MTFKKGKSGNPKGGPKLPDDIREANKLTKTMVMQLLTDYLSMRTSTLKIIARDDEKPVMHRAVASICLLMIEDGDHQRLNWFFDRLVGKVTDKIEHTMPRPILIEYPDGSAVKLGTEDEE